jgi:hypothetical protein
MRLLERGIARELNGTVAVRYEQSGLTCTIEAPVPLADEPRGSHLRLVQ